MADTPPQLPCTFYIVRHGQTAANVNDIVQGHLDIPLTETGILQAKAVAKKLQTVSFAAAFASDLLRAQRTAEILALEHHLAVTTNKLLREKHFGHFEGQSAEQYRAELKDSLETMETLSEIEQLSYKVAPDIESDEEILTRMLTFLRQTAIAYLGQKVLIVSHGAMMRALLLKLGYCTRRELPAKSIDNLGYIVLESDGSDFQVKETEGVNRAILESHS